MSPRPTVVAIPARNEEARIAKCVDSMFAQVGADGRPWTGPLDIVVVANNCTDATAARARALRHPGIAVTVHEVTFPPERAHAGSARAHALARAHDLLGEGSDGLILTTDADSLADPDWIASAWREIDRGVDAVAGTVTFHAEDGLPPASKMRARESLYAARQAQVCAAVDPLAHDPWPNHIWAWGANLAMTAAVYGSIEPVHDVPLAEDRALVARLIEGDFKVRHSPHVRVSTSARTDGRAPGGLSHLVAAYASNDDYPCDFELEPCELVRRRAGARRDFRVYRARKDRRTAARLLRDLDVPAWVLGQASARKTVGAGWAFLERHSRRLDRRRLFPADLEREIREAEDFLRARNGEFTNAAPAGLWLQAVDLVP